MPAIVMMKFFQRISFVCLLVCISYFYGCQSGTEKGNDPLDKGFADTGQAGDLNNVTKLTDESEPTTCIDWIGYYSEAIRELDSVGNIYRVSIKDESHGRYNSPDKLEGVYVLEGKDLPIETVGVLAKYLAYKLCLSNTTKLNGVLMDCGKRKVQVAIARSEKNYNNEAWAVVYNVYPANKKGELNELDFIK